MNKVIDNGVTREKKNPKLTYVFWFDINAFGVVENQHFPQRFQINAIVWWKLNSLIGPGHWLFDECSHYPSSKNCVSARKATGRHTRSLQSNYQLSVLTVSNSGGLYFVVRVVFSSWCAIIFCVQHEKIYNEMSTLSTNLAKNSSDHTTHNDGFEHNTDSSQFVFDSLFFSILIHLIEKRLSFNRSFFYGYSSSFLTYSQ